MAPPGSDSTSTKQVPQDSSVDPDIEKEAPNTNTEKLYANSKDVEKGQQENTLIPTPTHDPDYEVSYNGPSDPMNPRSRYSTRQKWVFVLLCSSTSLCVTCASSLYSMAYTQLEEAFGVSEIVATLGLSLFVVGLGLGPMLLGPLSEVSR